MLAHLPPAPRTAPRTPRRLRRPAALLTVGLLALPLAACGEDAAEGAEGFDAVEVSGEFGTTPEFDFSDTLVSGEEQQETLIEGEGPEIAEGDQVAVQLTVADGFSREVVIDSHSETEPGFFVTVGEEAADPQVAGDLLAGYVGDHIEPGMTVGTRFAITVGVDEAFPDYVTAFTDYEIGNADGLVLVADLTGTAADAVEGKAQPGPRWAPEIVEKKGVPARLDFTGVPEPSGKLRVATLIQGDGPELTAGTGAMVDYLGQVYEGAKPFDESFSAERTLTAAVGKDVEPITSTVTPVIEGWAQGLVGVEVGSRVIIEIPPDLGYGKKGQGEDIPGGSTLYFVVDVLGVA